MKLIISLALLTISGCVSQSTVLVNDKGQAIACNNSGWGVIGAPVAAAQHSNCLKRAQAAGYRVPTVTD